MYCINDEQIDFILNDISARGIETESLQHNLADHICCIIEHNLEKDGDFKEFYLSVISGFYKNRLDELENEAINLVINKNYYIMKKVMIYSGLLILIVLFSGIVLKFLHLPGAAVLVFMGIILFSFVFLPILFTLKIKDNISTQNKFIAGFSTLSGILISIGILFKLMHWPGASVLCIIAFCIMLFIFIPVYFFSGIKNPDTKINTIVSSILLMVSSALILTLIRVY